MHRWTFVVALLLPQAVEAAVVIEGTVYVDMNHDGALSPGEPVVPGAVVGWEDGLEAQADDQGHYQLYAPMPGAVWVRIPDGYAPSPVWRVVNVAAGQVTGVDLGLTPRATPLPLTFVHGSDTHVGLTTADETAQAMREATALDPDPAFLVVTGDLTDTSIESEFASFDQAVADGLSVPFVPVVGNHDVYDGGWAFRKHLGPLSYSFDAGGVHFITLSYLSTDDAQLRYVKRDLAFSPPGQTVVALMHVPPPPATADALRAAGVTYLLTGHIHQNQVSAHATLLEINTETLVMGGSDYSPAGYRILTFGDGGTLTIQHHTVVDRPIATLTKPHRQTCVAPGAPRLVATVEMGAPAARVTLTLDGQRVPLAPQGPWTWAADGPMLDAGPHSYELLAESVRGQSATETGVICVLGLPPGPAPELGDWPQLQGGPAHTGATATRVTPPLAVRWATDIGAHVRGGSPVVAAGRVFVTAEDLTDGTQGGLVALDAASGAVVWQDRTGVSVHNAAAATADVVVFIDSAGALNADDAATGRRLWSADIAPGRHSSVFVSTAPAIGDGVVYAGTARDFGAFDLASGQLLWSTAPANDYDGPTTYTSPAVAGGQVYDGFGYGANTFYTWDATGVERWHVGYPDYFAVQVSPVVADGLVFNVNVDNTVWAYDTGTGSTIWSRDIDGGGLIWGYAPVATPAAAHGRLFVATPHDYLYALDAATGAELWKAEGGYASVHAVKYRVTERGFLASPVVTGDLVWAGGPDGVLRALAVTDGALVWSDDFRVPILSAPAVSASSLILATYDGVVRLLAPARPNEIVVTGEAAGGGGGGCAVGGQDGGTAGILVVALLVSAARCRRRARPCRRQSSPPILGIGRSGVS